MRAVPELAGTLDRLAAELKDAERRRASARRSALARHVRSGEPEETFGDEWDGEFDELLESEHPDPDVDRELARAGWFMVILWRDRGERQVHCRTSVSRGDDVHGMMCTLSRTLACSLDISMDPEPARDAIDATRWAPKW